VIDMIKILKTIGLNSEVAYLASMASIAASIAAWRLAGTKGDDKRAGAERWGIFVGLWAPTFMALGNALKVEEKAPAGG
jgi:hypothetical protein